MVFGFFKRKDKYEELSRKYVLHVYAVGGEVCPIIADTIQTTLGKDVNFPINEDTNLEISLAILGTSLAILKGNSTVMTLEQGVRVEAFCKRTIERDCDFPPNLASLCIEILDRYQDAFQKSMSSGNNPFGSITGIMIVQCLGPQTMALCLPGSTNLNPVIHQVVGDVMTMIINQTMMYWKDKK